MMDDVFDADDDDVSSRTFLLNEKAVAMLYLGREEEAMTLLSEASFEERIKRHLPSMGPSFVTIAVGDQLPNLTRNTEMLVSPDGSFELFNRPFHFYEDLAYGVETSCIVSAVVLYNTGLCLHRRAMKSGRADLLEQARRTYSQSWSILQRQSKCDLVEVDRRFLLMGLSNNLGHIHGLLFRPNEARREREHLAAFVGTFPLQERIQFNKVFRFFSIGMIYFQSSLVENAPAA